jgi:hypothetical protein
MQSPVAERRTMTDDFRLGQRRDPPPSSKFGKSSFLIFPALFVDLYIFGGVA